MTNLKTYFGSNWKQALLLSLWHTGFHYHTPLHTRPWWCRCSGHYRSQQECNWKICRLQIVGCSPDCLKAGNRESHPVVWWGEGSVPVCYQCSTNHREQEMCMLVGGRGEGKISLVSRVAGDGINLGQS